MQRARFFEVVIEAAAPRLELLTISHEVRFDRRAFVVSHTVSKYILTRFDTLLSGHLSALEGEGLPHAAVDSRIADLATGRSWAPFPRQYCESVAAALAAAAKLALGSSPRVGARVARCGYRDRVLHSEREITTRTVSVLDQAVAVCGYIGGPDFVEERADLDRIVLRPRDSDLPPAELDLGCEVVRMPAMGRDTQEDWEPLSGFADAAQTNPTVSDWLLHAHHATALLRESAVRRFVESADQRVSQVRAAIGFQPLTDYRMEVVAGFVSRLQAGLGLSMAGLNEMAQITALDWAASLRGEAAAGVISAADTQSLPDIESPGAAVHSRARPDEPRPGMLGTGASAAVMR